MEVKDTAQAQTPPPDIQEVIKAKAAELAIREGCEVHPVLFYFNGDPKDPVIGYIKEPPRLVKFRMLDKGDQVGDYSAAAEVLEAMLLKSDSDPRIISDKAECDHLYIGAAMVCQNIIRVAINQVKKN